MSIRAIGTTDAHTSCDVCGRTLLRGERAEVYLSDGERRSVCELCTSRAVHEGWVREGTVPPYEPGDPGSDRRRSLLSRLRGRREGSRSNAPSPALADVLDDEAWPEAAPAPSRVRDPDRGPAPVRAREQDGEPRHVHAVPTSVEHKTSSAVELFNSSEQRRTVASIARSLGPPTVSVLPSEERASLMSLVVSWELCWYRYEVDLSDDMPSVRLAAQGYELDELRRDERTANATADEAGTLELAG